MFSYYGSKSKIIKIYPPALYDWVIEPFCGSARYAVRYYKNKVWINDIYTPVIETWKWIQKATLKDIRSLPNLRAGENLKDFDLSNEIKTLLGFVVNRGDVSPRNVRTQWSMDSFTVEVFKHKLQRICGKINHWKITNLDYQEIPNQKATWFIDPPYEKGGEHYPHNKINYKNLSRWCKSRRGQIIVCERSTANWLPFKPIKQTQTQRNKVGYTEGIWYRSDKTFGLGLY